MDRETWRDWGWKNQDDPENHPLHPHPSLPESTNGLQQVQHTVIETSLPRLPWGSRKALLIGLQSNQEPLESLVDELVSIEHELKKAHFIVDRIILNESQAEHELLVKLASNHWDIIHFSGHFSDREGQFVGLAWDLDVNRFVASCCRAAPPRLVVMNACSSGQDSKNFELASGISGTLAEQFCLRGVDAVVATRWGILDEVALLFSSSFYHAIAEVCQNSKREEIIPVDLEACMLQSRNDIKNKFPEMDAAWLAYRLFVSRDDGCFFPSILMKYPKFVPNGDHPAFLNPSEHTRLCEHLAPGGAGLYFMTGPAGCGKTTSARLALKTLELGDELLSLRHDDTLIQINRLFEALAERKAPLVPIVFDDAEALIPLIFDYKEKLHDISKQLPVLLILREELESYSLIRQLSTIIPTDSPDEITMLHPNLCTPEMLGAFLKSHAGMKLSEDELDSVFVRMGPSFFGFSVFFESHYKGNTNLDLLVPPKAARLLSRMSDISPDELLALQILAQNIEANCVQFRSQLAWEKLHDDGIVNTTPLIFQKLEHLGLLSSTASEDVQFSQDELKDLPNFFRTGLAPQEVIQELGFNPALIPLKTCYTVHHQVVDMIREYPPDQRRDIGELTFSTAFIATGMENLRRHQDGFDSRDGLARMMILMDREIGEHQEKSLLNVLAYTGGTQREHLSEVLSKRLVNERRFIEEILAIEEEFFTHFRGRTPSLPLELISQFTRFFSNHSHRFADDKCNFSLTILTLNTRYAEEPNHIYNSPNKKWHLLVDEASNKIHSRGSKEQRDTMKFETMKATLLHLYRTKSNTERQHDLIQTIVDIKAFQPNEPWDRARLLLEACQVSYRHLLFRANATMLAEFQELCHEFTNLFLTHKDSNRIFHERKAEMKTKVIWFNIGYLLLDQRQLLSRKQDPVVELRWIGDLMEAGRLIVQLDPTFSKAIYSEAASRLLSIKYRKNTWFGKNKFKSKRKESDLNRVLAKLVRDVLALVAEDAGTQKKEITVIEDLLPHLFNTYDNYHQNSPVGKSMEFMGPMPSKISFKEHQRGFDILERAKFHRLADQPRNLASMLKIQSATNMEFDKLMGPRDGEPISRIARLLFFGLKDIGIEISGFAQFALTFPETLTEDERAEVNDALSTSKIN